jgi:hypothetical protein
MLEIGTPGLMSGAEKRVVILHFGDTTPRLSSTPPNARQPLARLWQAGSCARLHVGRAPGTTRQCLGSVGNDLEAVSWNAAYSPLGGKGSEETYLPLQFPQGRTNVWGCLR